MQLQRTLGWKEATSLGIGAMVGAGIFVLSGVATGKAGPAVMVSFILASLLAILLGLCYGELASRYPRAGGSYEYARETMGDFIGTIVGWAYWGAWLAASSFVSQGFGHYLNALTGAPPKLSAVLLLIGLGMLNIVGIKFSGKLQVGIVCTVIAVLIGFFIFGFKNVNFSYYQPFSPNGFSGILEATLVGFLSIVGWDAIVASGEEIRNPKKVIPLAIITSIMVVLFLYLGLLFVSIGVIPWQEFGASEVPVALASQQFLGDLGPIFISLIIVLALPATCNAFIITISRTAFAMGRNGLLPKKIAYIHPRFQTPIWAITLGVGIQIAFTLISSINIAVTATGFLYLLTFIFTIIAFFISRKRATIKDKEAQFYVPFYPFIPISALLICLGLLIPVGKSGFLTGLLWLSFGIGIYLLRLRVITNTEKVNLSNQATNS
ncbi:gamma-aminobutyrate permease-like transporter [Schinkia azotoformans MEV2011]|uniref:Gamma-aminobutyrate permease-like transporter n=1 Tax=Schinkia azotoformans MEV2011 TaxID=1348973 RepID=A0A072P1I2_SCHAZ|nr:amino acid permease [Schinkia azotoformans]KEF39350.1 gamma-aminobutyrate permease-like transporter [Schinkia azotoformans MEV2011]MEC1694898.1 amino acid permease [Schinkia azotoformans]MEC1725509.1 amino acid permease [Schinkia azotoformans]MEC1770676.1 amino acid permease [Schinkia azotoformans]MEC1778151.1 amino acid permease [Schinkia azotoformans]